MKEKRFIIVKHLNGAGPFLFLVPDGVVAIFAGTIVECDTKKGRALGVTMCRDYMGEPDVICPLFGTTMEKMRYVTAEYIRSDTGAPKNNTEVRNEDGQPEQRYAV